MHGNFRRTEEPNSVPLIMPREMILERAQTVDLTGQLPPAQDQPLTAHQMIAEIHKYLVLGGSPAAVVSSSFQNAGGNERAHVVRPVVIAVDGFNADT